MTARRRLSPRRWPTLYLRWAGAMLALYQALAWSRGRLGAAFDRLEAISGGGAGRARGS